LDRTLGLRGGTEDETEEYVDTSQREEEERRNKGKVIYVAREDLSRDTKNDGISDDQ